MNSVQLLGKRKLLGEKFTWKSIHSPHLMTLGLRKQELERQAHKFKAKEAVVLRAAPFALQPVQRFDWLIWKNSQVSGREREPIIQGPDLCTDRRAMEREKFEASGRMLQNTNCTVRNWVPL